MLTLGMNQNKQGKNMKNFEKFGIESLSYSQLTSFHYSRGQWILEKILGNKFPYKPSAIRGFAVEKAIENFYTIQQDPLKFALDYYDHKIDEEKDKYVFTNETDADKFARSVNKERIVVERIVPKAIVKIEEALNKPTYLMSQKKIEMNICGIKFVGYIDFVFYSNDGDIILDLKTSGQKTGLKHSHQLQQSIYWAGTGINPAILYAYPTDTYYKKLTHMNTYFAQVEKMVSAMDRFLGMVESKQELIALTQPDFDDWKWDSQNREIRKEVFGV